MSTKETRSSKLDAITSAVLSGDLTPPITPGRARSIPAPTQLVNFSQEFQATQKELEDLKKTAESGVQLEIAKLKESPFQHTGLEESRVLALVENLKSNPQSSPIVVRRIASADDSGPAYEIVAGHHRVEAFKRLGREQILGVVALMSDDEAERSVFYDNLLAPSLSDYQKYMGFAGRRESKKMTQAELCAESGVSPSTMTRFFSIEKLPKEAQELIADNHKSISSHAYYKLAPYAKEHTDKVYEALLLVIQGKLATANLDKFFHKKSPKPLAVESSSETKDSQVPTNPAIKEIKVGSSVYASLLRTKQKIAISFESELSAQQFEEKLFEFIRRETSQVN